VPDNNEPQTEARLLEHLVGSVLSSIVKSQGLAATQLVEMIEQIGFEPPTEGEARKARTFSFDFFRSEVDEATNEMVRRRVTANVPLLTLVNLPAIAIEEAKINMDLRLVAHEESGTPEDDQKPLRLFAVPAKKQLVRTPREAFAIDSAGTVKIQITMRQQETLGLEKVQNLLESGTEELISPESEIINAEDTQALPLEEPLDFDESMAFASAEAPALLASETPAPPKKAAPTKKAAPKKKARRRRGRDKGSGRG
jgi:hypothetical protein